MATIFCRECRGKVSSEADVCPLCGVPRPGAKHKRAKRIALSIVGIVVGLFLFNALRSESGSDAATTSTAPAVVTATTTPASSPPPTMSPAEREQKRQQMLRDMDDPTSPTVARALAAEWLIREVPDSSDAKHAAEELPSLRQKMAEESVPVQWSYGALTDEMTSRPIPYAIVTSDNTFDFDFPYSGSQHAMLMLGVHPRYGKQVVFSVEKGQILCHEYGDCSISIRFDDDRPISLRGNPPADMSTERVYLPVWSKMMARLKTAKTLRIQFQVYQEGDQVATFNVKGFDFAKLK